MNVWSNSVLPRSTTSPALAAIAIALLCAADPAGATGNAARGQTLYKGCADCHSITENNVGPMHKGVVGRKSAALDDFRYSNPMKRANLVWDAANLRAYLIDPQSKVKGNRMPFGGVADPAEADDLVAYLQSYK